MSLLIKTIVRIGYAVIPAFALSMSLLAQTEGGGSVRGTVLSDSLRTPIPYVNVLVYNRADTTLVTGMITDSTGKFDIKNIPWGEYRVRCDMVGYKSRMGPPFLLDRQHKRFNMGTILLVSSAVNLEEVTVTAETPTMVRSIDRIVYNVDQDILGKAESADELLENIPSVQVDLNGEVRLRGSSRVLLMINGKRSPVLERQEGDFLEQLPASSIEKIEVITTPSARYRAEGKSGIINIVLKKDTPLGMHGNVAAHIGTGERGNGHIRLNYSPGRFNIYGSYSFRRENRNRVNSDIRSEATSSAPNTVSSIYVDSTFAFAHPITHLATLGFDYHLDSSNSFGVSASYFRNAYDRTDSSHRVLMNVQGAVFSEYARNDSGAKADEEYGATVNFHHYFSRQDHKLHIELTGSRSPETDVYRFINTYLSPPFPSAFDNALIGERDDKGQIAIDYSNVISKQTTVEAGLTGEYNRTDLNYYAENLDLIQNQFLEDTAKTSRYRYDESIQSMYCTWKQSVGKFGFLGGFRVERMSGVSDLQVADSLIKSDYWNLFPSLHLSYAFDSTSDLKLSYSRRISRPRGRDLNPFAEYRDPRNISYGNAALVPEYIHSLELGYQYQDSRLYILPSVFYRYSSNDIFAVKQLVNRSTLQTTKQNVVSDQSVGLELILSWRAGTIFSTRLSTTGLYEQLDASNIGNGQYKSNLSWSGTITSELDVAKATKVEVHARFNSLRLTPQGQSFPSSTLNIGLRQGFLDGKLQLTATVSDIFKTLIRHSELTIPRLQQVVYNTRDSRIFYLGLTYRFGSTPKKTKEEQFYYEEDDD